MKVWARLLLGMSAVLTTGCQSAGYRPTGDTARWITHRVDLGETIVEFSIPPGESPEFSAFPVPSRVDVTRSDLFDQALQGPRLLYSAWDYRSGAMSAVDGTLTAYMQIHRSERPLDSMQALKHAIEERGRLIATLEYAESGRSGPSNFPVQFDRVTVGGREALRVRFEITRPSYAVVVGRHAYLMFNLGSSSVQRPDWKKDAEAARDAIFESIRIVSR